MGPEYGHPETVAGMTRRPGAPGLVYETVLISLHIDDESGLMDPFLDG